MILIALLIRSVSFWFGLIVGFGGFFGLTFGSALSYYLRPRIKWVDPVSVARRHFCVTMLQIVACEM